jgi:hypothetical protein
MRWRWLGWLAFLPGAIVVYACTSDSFVGTDAGDAGEAGADAQADFCSGEAAFFAKCSYDASCYQKDLNNCGYTFSTLNPATAAAFATCAKANELNCGDLFSVVTQPCAEQQLATFVNDGGAFAKLTASYCQRCGVANCAATFGAAPPNAGVGYPASLVDDTIIAKIDALCGKADASPADCSFFEVCEVYQLYTAIELNACNDGGW